ncbi:MAG TPA: SufE family protein [Aggregatilineales bacterium]|nr:SufE family protein [Aggregatilineales bacterium]
MTDAPQKLQSLLTDFAALTDRHERAEYLIEIADRFKDVRVPAEISTRPHPEENHVQMCESDAYVWAVPQADGTQKYYFDVLNPQGLSAMALSVILSESLSNQPLDAVANVKSDIVFTIFGREVAMGKGQGLMGIVNMVQYAAKTKLSE